MNIFKKCMMLLAFAFISMALIPGDGYAEASNRFRSGCGIKKRYKSKAKVTQPGWFNDCSDTDRSCSYSVAICIIPLCGNARADAGPGVNSTVTNVIDSDCSAGQLASDMFYDLLATKAESNKVGYNIKNELSHNQSFDLVNRTFSFIGGTGALRIAKSYPGYAKWSISFGKDVGVGEEENVEFFREEYIMIKDNKMVVSDGIDLGNSYQIFENEDAYVIQLTDYSQTFFIPEGIDMDSELVVDISSYADADEARIISEKLATATSNVTVYPNPTSGAFQLDVITPAESDFEVTVYDNMGTRIRDSKRYSATEAKLSIISTDLGKDLTPGVYYIMIHGEAISEMRKLVVQ